MRVRAQGHCCSARGAAHRTPCRDADYRRRVELLQDFTFKTASQRVKTSRDGNYVFATGLCPFSEAHASGGR